MRWNPSDRESALRSAGDGFIAVLGPDGVMIGQSTDREEALAIAEQASPTGTVLIDETVDAGASNPSRANIEVNPSSGMSFSEKALAASRIPSDRIRIDWDAFDPFDAAGKATVREARQRLRDRGRALYDELLEEFAGNVNVKVKRGGVAADFHNDWLTSDFLRQNMKMKKVLDTGDSYDSIGLSLLPHGASFRDPFSTSTDQGPQGATNCLFSTAECRKVCLVNTGQRALESGSFAASYLFSVLLRELPEEFMVNLFERCVLAFREASFDEFYRFIRLNVLSDLPWELLAPGFLEAVTDYIRKERLRRKAWSWEKGFAFYDYTKIPWRAGIPDVYDLTLSFSGSKALFPAFFDVLEGKRGSAKRSAVVFVRRENDVWKGTGVPYRAMPGKPLMSAERSYHPWTFMGEKVWNGDLSDIRPLDPDEVKVVGLAYKIARYKVAAPRGSGKKYALQNIVPVDELDKQMPTFLVRVIQPDPAAPPIVMATQDPDNRKLVLPVLR